MPDRDEPVMEDGESEPRLRAALLRAEAIAQRLQDSDNPVLLKVGEDVQNTLRTVSDRATLSDLEEMIASLTYTAEAYGVDLDEGDSSWLRFRP